MWFIFLFVIQIVHADFIRTGACYLKGWEVNETVFCSPCNIFTGQITQISPVCSKTYWSDVTNCASNRSANGVIYPGGLNVPCNEKHKILCICEDLTCPTQSPTNSPVAPTNAPTKQPTVATNAPTKQPTKAPSKSPSWSPSKQPTKSPVLLPTSPPTKVPPITTSPTPLPTSSFVPYVLRQTFELPTFTSIIPVGVGNTHVVVGVFDICYMYERETWITWSEAEVFTDPVTNIGRVLCMDGDRFATGSYGSHENNNRIIVYTWNGASWERQQELTVDAEDDDYAENTFPTECTLSGNILVVLRNSDGSLWTWEYNGTSWVNDNQRLPFADGFPSDKQGMQFVYTSGYLLVTIPYQNDGFGCVIVYQRMSGEWLATQYFCDPPEFTGEHEVIIEYEGSTVGLGAGLACRGTTCIITSREDTDNPYDQRTIRVFTLVESTWTIQQTIHAIHGSDKVLLTSSSFITSDPSFNDTGQVLVYDSSSFQSLQNITIETPYTWFGTRIQAYEDQLVVAPDPIEDARVYVYTQLNNAYTKMPTTAFPSHSPTVETAAPTNSPLLFVAYDQLGDKIDGTGTVYGFSVAMTNDYAFVGLNGEEFEIDAYKRTGDTFSVEQTISVPGAEDGYKRVCAKGDHLLIGVASYNTSGGVFYYTLVESTWTLTGDVLVGSDLLPYSQFGYSMDLSDSTLTAAIGAPFYDNTRGKVYIFKRTGGTWTEDYVITRDSPEAGDSVGSVVKLSSDETTLAVGCHYFYAEDTVGSRILVYVYEIDTWVLKSELSGYRGMGYALGFLGTQLIATAVNADRTDYLQVFASKLITYEKQGDEYVELHVQDIEGETFVINDDMLFLGDAMGIETSGSVTVYQKQESGWLQSITIQGTDGADLDKQGYSIAAHGDYLVVGAPLTTTGAIWFFKRTYTP